MGRRLRGGKWIQFSGAGFGSGRWGCTMPVRSRARPARLANFDLLWSVGCAAPPFFAPKPGGRGSSGDILIGQKNIQIVKAGRMAGLGTRNTGSAPEARDA